MIENKKPLNEAELNEIALKIWRLNFWKGEDDCQYHKLRYYQIPGALLKTTYEISPFIGVICFCFYIYSLLFAVECLTHFWDFTQNFIASSH